MARRTSKITAATEDTAEAPVAETTTDATEAPEGWDTVEGGASENGGEVTGDEAAQADFDASTDAAKDVFFAQFKVEAATVLNSPAKKIFGDKPIFDVTRQRKGNYVASYSRTVAEGDDAGEVVTTTGKEARNPTVAVRNAVKAMGASEREVLFDAVAAETAQSPIPEAAGSNQPDKFFFDEESEIASRLDHVAEDVRAADALLSGADADTRKGWRAFGAAYLAGRAIFAEAGYAATEGEDAKKGNAAWGMWLRTRFAGSSNVEKILASKNAANQAGLFASAPGDIVDLVGVNTASTFERKVNEAVGALAASVAEVIAKSRSEREDSNKTLTDTEATEAAGARLALWESTYAAAFADWQKEAGKAAEKGKAPVAFTKAADKVRNTLSRWVFDTNTPKVIAAVRKAYDAEANAPTEEERAEAAATKATAAIVKKFAEMDVSEATKHLLLILVSHPKATDVYNALGDDLEDYLTKQEKAASEAKAKEAADAAGEKGAE